MYYISSQVCKGTFIFIWKGIVLSSNLSYRNESVDLKRSGFCKQHIACVCLLWWSGHLTAKTVEGTALTFEGVDDVHGGDGLPLGVLSVCDSIPDHVLEEYLEDTTGFFVDETADSLDTTSSGQTPDCRLGNTLDIVSQDFPVTLSASFTKPLTALATSSHGAK